MVVVGGGGGGGLRGRMRTCGLVEVFLVGAPEIGTVLCEPQEEMECLPHVQQIIICEGGPSHWRSRVYDCYGTVL